MLSRVRISCCQRSHNAGLTSASRYSMNSRGSGKTSRALAKSLQTAAGSPFAAFCQERTRDNVSATRRVVMTIQFWNGGPITSGGLLPMIDSTTALIAAS